MLTASDVKTLAAFIWEPIKCFKKPKLCVFLNGRGTEYGQILGHKI